MCSFLLSRTLSICIFWLWKWENNTSFLNKQDQGQILVGVKGLRGAVLGTTGLHPSRIFLGFSVSFPFNSVWSKYIHYGSVCKQIDWAATGSSVSADIADLHIGNFTKPPLSSALGGPEIWERYVEDTYIINGNNFLERPTRVERAVEIKKWQSKQTLKKKISMKKLNKKPTQKWPIAVLSRRISFMSPGLLLNVKCFV